MNPFNFILNSLMALLPILGWIYFFQKQHPEKKGYVILTFLAGMLSVFPIKFYERYLEFSVWKFEHLNLFKYLSELANMPSLPKFLGYVTMDILVAAGLFIFVALLMFCLEIFSKDNTFLIFRKSLLRFWNRLSFLFLSGFFAELLLMLLLFPYTKVFGFL